MPRRITRTALVPGRLILEVGAAGPSQVRYEARLALPADDMRVLREVVTKYAEMARRLGPALGPILKAFEVFR